MRRLQWCFASLQVCPWNPGTRLATHRCEFDDAICLSPPAARRLLRRGEFEALRTDYPIFFPRPLCALERSLAGVPLGGQYLVLGQRR
jgi:hypothetical protein